MTVESEVSVVFKNINEVDAEWIKTIVSQLKSNSIRTIVEEYNSNNLQIEESSERGIIVLAILTKPGKQSAAGIDQQVLDFLMQLSAKYNLAVDLDELKYDNNILIILEFDGDSFVTSSVQSMMPILAG